EERLVVAAGDELAHAPDEVGVGAAVARERRPERRHGDAEAGAVQDSGGGARGPEGLERDEDPAWAEDAPDLVEPALEGGEVANAEPADHGVERRVVEWKRERVADDRLDARRLAPPLGEHLRRGVASDDARAGVAPLEQRRE